MEIRETGQAAFPATALLHYSSTWVGTVLTFSWGLSLLYLSVQAGFSSSAESRFLVSRVSQGSSCWLAQDQHKPRATQQEEHRSTELQSAVPRAATMAALTSAPLVVCVLCSWIFCSVLSEGKDRKRERESESVFVCVCVSQCVLWRFMSWTVIRGFTSIILLSPPGHRSGHNEWEFVAVMVLYWWCRQLLQRLLSIEH